MDRIELCWKFPISTSTLPFIKFSEGAQRFVPLPAKTNASRTTKYERFDGIEFPVKIRDIGKFEKMSNIGISIFGWEEDEVIPNELCLHCWIKTLDGLLHDQRKHRGKLHFCRRCLLPQYSEQSLLRHYELCRKNKPSRVVMPEKDCLEFSNYHRMERAPYFIYADFEALLLKMDSCSPAGNVSYTTKYQQHEPCGFGLIDVFGCCADKMEIEDYFTYRGSNAVDIFLNKIVELTEQHM